MQIIADLRREKDRSHLIHAMVTLYLECHGYAVFGVPWLRCIWSAMVTLYLECHGYDVFEVPWLRCIWSVMVTLYLECHGYAVFGVPWLRCIWSVMVTLYLELFWSCYICLLLELNPWSCNGRAVRHVDMVWHLWPLVLQWKSSPPC